MKFTFNLPACPCCSHITGPRSTPYWHYCGNTSRVRGKAFAILTGCHHVAAISGNTMASEEESVAIDARWEAETERLFTLRTARWGSIATTRLAVAIGRLSHKHTLDLQ